MLAELFTNHHDGAYPLQDSPCTVYSYDDMMWDNLGQDICGSGEVVLSLAWPYEEENIQVLTYGQLKEAIIAVLRERPDGDEQLREFMSYLSS